MYLKLKPSYLLKGLFVVVFTIVLLLWEIPLGGFVEGIVDWIVINLGWLLDGISYLLESLVDSFKTSLLFLPALWMIPVLTGIVVVISNASLIRARAPPAEYLQNLSLSVLAFLGLLLIQNMGLWEMSMATLALVIVAALVALGIGVPLGILGANHDRLHAVLRVLLDFMQTMPSFVYLIPAVIFFGLGDVPGIIATVIFAMPPAIRLTTLGIRQIPKELIEVSEAFGATPTQKLIKIQLPVALPTIMAGINQCIMLALSMTVIASMIGAGGLGYQVLTGIQMVDIGMGFEAGLAIVIIAIVLDRLTQNLAST